MAGDLIRGLEVDLEDGGLLVFAALVASGVDIDGHQRFGFIHHEVAAALEVNLAGEGVLELAGDIEAVENGLGLFVELDLVCGALGLDLQHHLPHAFIGLGVVDDDTFHIFGQEVAHGAFDEVGFLEDASGGRLGLDTFLDLRPLLEQ